MFSDSQARAILRKLVLDHIDKPTAEVERLINIIDDPARQIPIRGALEAIRTQGDNNFTAEELEIIDDLIYLYG
ncbi:hypothetical protein ACFPTX_17020 [Pseudomonas sp. GCM10022188]|uniref:hypothetical protein n=1 Tax=Pseudomonas TaxID=286 RepID=UPI001E3DB59A|nr:hypothetical protein [Pseudomonas oryzagri]MCC6074179.1 hypothetical protein [Pseudomonas oryzagri]